MTNKAVLEKMGEPRQLLGMVKKRKLQYFGHVVRQEDALEKDIMNGFVNGTRRKGRPRTSWMNNITKWTGFTVLEVYRATENRHTWRQLIDTVAQHRSDEQGA